MEVQRSTARARGHAGDTPKPAAEANQLRRCAGRRAGAHRRGEGPRSLGRECRAPMAAIRGDWRSS
jgi:hypothetical protein